MMKKFDIDFEIKKQLEQAQFKRRRLELENAYEGTTGGREWARAQSEENSIRDWWCSFLINSSPRPSDKPTFYWSPKRRDVSDWASRIDDLLKSNRLTTRFKATPEVNRRSHFSRYRSSQYRSSSVEDRDLSPRGSLQNNNSYSIRIHLPKLKLNNFDGNSRVAGVV